MYHIFSFSSHNISGDIMNELKRSVLTGIIAVSTLGTVWHFVYEWSGEHFLAGFFFPINESTWEHMKLCFFPMLLYSFYMNIKLKKHYPGITAALLSSVLSGTFSIPVIFYTYSGILGYHVTVLDIAVFIISVSVSFFTVYRLSLSCKAVPYKTILKLSVLILALCFFLFTYLTPGIGIFTSQAVVIYFPSASFLQTSLQQSFRT